MDMDDCFLLEYKLFLFEVLGQVIVPAPFYTFKLGNLYSQQIFHCSL